MWGGKGSGRGENLGGHEVFAPLNDAGLFFNLPFVVRHRQNGAEPREAGAAPWLGITGGCNEPGMRTLQAGSRISAVIFEDGDVVTAVHTQQVISAVDRCSAVTEARSRRPGTAGANRPPTGGSAGYSRQTAQSGGYCRIPSISSLNQQTLMTNKI